MLEEKTKRNQLRTPATVNRYFAALSHVFTVAIKEWQWIEENPLLKITKPKEPRGRIRFLSDEERQGLLEICKTSENKILYMVVVLALSTGARRMELLGLHWKDVDLQRGVIILHETKNGERRVLTLSGHALKLMKQHEIVCSLEILDEYSRVSDILAKKYPSVDIAPFINLMIRDSEIFTPIKLKTPVSRDPEDDKFIAIALGASCHLIVSGDNDLLSVTGYKDQASFRMKVEHKFRELKVFKILSETYRNFGKKQHLRFNFMAEIINLRHGF